MFELLTLIANTIVKSISIPVILEYKRKRRLNEIGTELFLLYVSLNDILALGRSIVEELERSIEWMEEMIQNNQPNNRLLTHLDFKLHQQHINILRFFYSLRRLALEMQVISPEGYRSILPLMQDKWNAIRKLGCFLSGEIDLKKLSRLTYLTDEDYKEIHRMILAGGDISLITGTPEGRGPESAIASKLEWVNIKNIESIEAREYTLLKDYLQQRRPEKHLDEIEQSLKLLREAIEKHFSLQDILLSVGDRRNVMDNSNLPFM